MQPVLSSSSQEDVLNSEACWLLLERVASSSQLKKAARLRELLLFVGRRSLKEGRQEVHEKEIGVEVFGRQETYDTSVDNIVRSNVSDLRKRIETYFHTEGLGEPVIMEIPRGSYVPVFRLRDPERVSVPDFPVASVQSRPNVQVAVAGPIASLDKPKGTTIRRVAMWALTLACVSLLIASLSLWNDNRELKNALYPWRLQPSVAAFWSGFMDAPQSTDIVLGDTSFRLLQRITKQSFTLQDYLSRSYLKEVDEQHFSPEMHAVLESLSSRNLGTESELNLAQSLLALDAPGKKLHLYHARDYLPDLLKTDNVILIGSQFGNPWDQLFEGQVNFIAKDDFESPAPSVVIINRAPAAGEQANYKPGGSVAYCTIAYLPNPQSNGKVLLIGGAGTGSLEAARDFLLSDGQLSAFRQSLHVEKLPFFDVLIRVQVVKGTPVEEKIVAYRVYSNGRQ